MLQKIGTVQKIVIGAVQIELRATEN